MRRHQPGADARATRQDSMPTPAPRNSAGSARYYVCFAAARCVTICCYACAIAAKWQTSDAQTTLSRNAARRCSPTKASARLFDRYEKCRCPPVYANIIASRRQCRHYFTPSFRQEYGDDGSSMARTSGLRRGAARACFYDDIVHVIKRRYGTTMRR